MSASEADNLHTQQERLYQFTVLRTERTYDVDISKTIDESDSEATLTGRRVLLH